MNLRLKLALITVTSALVVSALGVGVLYQFASRHYLQSRVAQLKQETQIQIQHQIQIVRQAEDSVIALTDLLKKEFALPPDPAELQQFDQTTERDKDGVVRSRKSSFDGKHEAGLFLAPGVPLTDQEKRIKIRAKDVITEFGASALRHFDGVWFDQLNKTSVIFWRPDPDFIYKLPSDHDYTQTEWNQLASPRLNPARVPRWTPAILETPVGVWVVSVVYPLDQNGRWEGIVGHDLALTELLQSFKDSDFYQDSEHFLIDGYGNYILAGPWQRALEEKADGFRPNLSTEPQLQAILEGNAPVQDGVGVRVQGRDYAVFALPIERLGWRYFRLIPIDSVLAPVRELLLLITGLMVSIALALAITLRFATTRWIVTPISRLAKLVQHFGQGGVWQRQSGQVHDEVGQLGHSFDTMAQRLEVEREKLMRSEERHRNVVDGINETVFQIDQNACFVFLSRRWQEHFGHAVQTSLGQPLWTYLHAPDGAAFQLEFEQIVRGGSTPFHAREYRIRCANGLLRWVEINAQLSSSAPGLTGSLDDISQRKRSQQLDLVFQELAQKVTDHKTTDDAPLDLMAPRLAEIYACTVVLMRREGGALRIPVSGGRLIDPGELPPWPEGTSQSVRTELLDAAQFPSAWQQFLQAKGLQSAFSLPLGQGGFNLGDILFLDVPAEAFQDDTLASMRSTAERIRALLQTESDQQWLRLIQTALETTVNAALIARADGTIVWVNAALSRMSGYDKLEILGQTPRMFNSGMQSAGFWKHFWDTIKAGKPWSHEVINRRKNASLYPIRQTVTPLLDASGRASHYISVQEDIQHEKEAQERLLHLATHDPLTNLPNRSLLLEHLHQATNAAQRAHQKVGILFIDLDHFKLINDSLGHLAGDELLRQVTERLTIDLRTGDTLARLGGDEFVLLLPAINTPMDAATVAEKLLATLRAPMVIQGQTITIGCSIGISLYPNDGDDPGILLQNADTAMYTAKESGRNGFQFFLPDMNLRVVHRMELEKDLRQALINQEFILHYQPQIEIASGRVIGLEALVRWQHPRKGLISPLDFVPVAEETGLIVALGDWVLQTACNQVKRWDEMGLSTALTMAVNVSVRQFNHNAIVQSVRATLQSTALAPQRLELEITESLMLEKQETHIDQLHQLHTMGVRLSLDDFGTGFSSLGYLKHLPFDVLKIDRSFVQDIGVDPGDDAITVSIIGLAHNLGMKALAEGVESVAQREFLRLHRCDYEQGYLFSRPLPAHEIETLLRQNASK